jgi:uncharacterized protein YegP (UPF0339 family)
MAVAKKTKRRVILPRTQHATKAPLTFTIYELMVGGDKEFAWNLKSANGQIVAQGESYETIYGVFNVVSLIQALAGTSVVNVLETGEAPSA